ncbi:uncharacterized protein LOC135495297 [Lineus longissimus]|uniref:uncharacterized protein LOC135495297 n=1 Tax=Lineus longissimus TaxID=88925 RepID=UPI002B4E78E3
MDGRHDKLLKNGNSNHIRKNLGVGAKSSKPHDEPEGSLGQAENGKHSWAPIIPSQLASSNQKFADLSHCRPSESVKVEQLREKRHRSGRTSHKAAEAHHVSLTAEAMEEFRELIRDPSFCLRFECIPDVVGPVCSRDYKTRRRMMALELLLKQMPTIKKQIQDQDATFDPYEMLSCTYLRLSSNNIKTLVEMCREAGLDVDYHPHMDESDPKLSLTGSVIASSAIPQRVSSPEGVKTSPPTEQQNLRECFPNAD